MIIQVPEVFIPPDRQRKKVDEGKISELAVSIQAHGLLNAIVVKPVDRVRFPDAPQQLKYQLVAGYRRLLAHALLKRKEIEAKLLEQVDELEAEEIELDENIMREQLSWQDEVKAKARLVELRKVKYGDSIRDVADHVGESRGELWEDTRLAKAMEVMPELAHSKNKSQAQNKLRLIARRLDLTEKAEKIMAESKEMAESFETKVFQGPWQSITPKWTSGIAGCVITDPPYGIDLDEGETKKGSPHPEVYADNHYDVMDDIELMMKEAFRLLKDDAHAYFFFDIKNHAKVLAKLQSAGFTVDPIPLIWVKPGPGQTNHPDSRWGSGYEACFFCRKGARALLKQGQSNVLTHDPVPGNKKIHPVEKPTSLLRQLIESSTAPQEIVIDFYGGSGSTAEAAIQTGRNFLICEKDPAYYAGIVERLRKYAESQVNGEAGGDATQQSKYDPLAGEEEE